MSQNIIFGAETYKTENSPVEYQLMFKLMFLK